MTRSIITPTTSPTTPKDEDDLSEAFFTSILKKRYGSDCPNVVSVTTHREHSGVLSQVFRVALAFEQKPPPLATDNTAAADNTADTSDSNNDDSNDLPPSHWIVKLVRDDLNLGWMCRNERRFYSIYAPKMLQGQPSSPSPSSLPTSRLPFKLPAFLDGSDSFLILEQVLDVNTIALVDGCPTNKVETMVECLAALHATWWNHPFLISNNMSDKDVDNANSLVFPVGMGQRLPALQKEGLFVRSWQDTLENMTFRTNDNDVRSFIQSTCQQLSSLRLRDVHHMVHKHRITLVHGDYHVANWLWPSFQSTSIETATSRRPYIVDWATAGCGNPLVDLVFFLVVSTNVDCVSNLYVWLTRYYDLLLKYNPKLRSALELETLREMMMTALLCQWLILVSYDAMCREIATNQSNETKREMTSRHFNNVNLRTVLAMKSLEGWDACLNRIPQATDEERLEAQAFCDGTPLVI